MIVVESKDLEKFHKALKEIDGGRALPYAARDSLTMSAYQARFEWA